MQVNGNVLSIFSFSFFFKNRVLIIEMVFALVLTNYVSSLIRV